MNKVKIALVSIVSLIILSIAVPLTDIDRLLSNFGKEPETVLCQLVARNVTDGELGHLNDDDTVDGYEVVGRQPVGDPNLGITVPVCRATNDAQSNKITTDEISEVKVCRSSDGSMNVEVKPSNFDLARLGTGFTYVGDLQLVRENITVQGIKAIMISNPTELYGDGLPDWSMATYEYFSATSGSLEILSGECVIAKPQ